MSGSPNDDFRDRVKDYADALTLGDLYKEPGYPVDEFGREIKPARRTVPFAPAERIAAMLAEPKPESADVAAIDNQLLTNERPEIIWPDHEEIIARIRARTRIRSAAE